MKSIKDLVTQDDRKNIIESIRLIKDSKHDKLHKNRGSMANRISLAVYSALENKQEDIANNYEVIKASIYSS